MDFLSDQFFIRWNAYGNPAFAPMVFVGCDEDVSYFHTKACNICHWAIWSCKDTRATHTTQRSQTNPSSLIFGNGCDEVFAWNSCRTIFL